MFRHAITIIIRQPILPILADLNVKTKLSWATVLHSHYKITKNQSVTSTNNNSSFNFQQQQMVTHIKTIHTKFIPAPYAQACHHYCHQTAHPADPSRSKNIKKSLEKLFLSNTVAKQVLTCSVVNNKWFIPDPEPNANWICQILDADPDPGKSSHPCGSGSR